MRSTICLNVHALRAALSRPLLANPLILDVVQIHVTQVRRRAGRAVVHAPGRCGSSMTSRRWAIGPALARSSAVRASCRGIIAARLGGSRSLLSCLLLYTSQDRSRVVLPHWPQSRRLRTFTARDAHAHVRRVVCACRTQESGRAVRAICSPAHRICYFDR